MTTVLLFLFFFFFNDTATTEIYTLSLHDALPISLCQLELIGDRTPPQHRPLDQHPEQRRVDALASRSEEHTSELQSQSNLVCRLLLEKKKKKITKERACNSLKLSFVV